MFEKLLDKKKKDGKELDPMYKDSKMSMLKALREEMSGLMKGDLQKGGMSKVEVSAENPEDLGEGLETAQDIVESPMSTDPVVEDEGSDGQLSEDEIEQLEQLLAKLKKSKQMGMV